MPPELNNARYAALKSFRKSGEEVVTPVWFASDANELYVFTEKNSGKVKRIRNNGSIELAPCSMRGTLKGGWTTATAAIDESRDTLDHVVELLGKKYGLEYRLYAFFGGRDKFVAERVILRIRLTPK